MQIKLEVFGEILSVIVVAERASAGMNPCVLQRFLLVWPLLFLSPAVVILKTIVLHTHLRVLVYRPLCLKFELGPVFPVHFNRSTEGGHGQRVVYRPLSVDMLLKDDRFLAGICVCGYCDNEDLCPVIARVIASKDAFFRAFWHFQTSF